MVADDSPAGSAPARKIEIFGWCMFDFANSSFTTVIVTVVFSVYFTKIVCGGVDGERYWGIATLISQGLVLITAPLLGALADFSGAKKRFLTATWLCCCTFTALLYLVRPGDVGLGIALFVLANVVYSAGENFNASFLPELATPETMGRVSGYGWALGYFGGLFALLLCMPFIGGDDAFTVAHAHDLRLTALLTAGFFFLAGVPTYLFLKERGVAQVLPPGETYVSIAVRRVAETLTEVRRYEQLFRFFLVFSYYNMGLCAVVNFAAIFAEKTLEFRGGDLIRLFLLIQITAAAGAFALGYFQDRFGPKLALTVSLAVWVGVSLGCWAATTKGQFMIVGNLAGLAIGASQSGARALIALMSPRSRSAEFFGFWGLFWKLSAALGPFIYSVLATRLGHQRAALANGGFFLIGLVFMQTIDVEAGRRAAARADELEAERVASAKLALAG
jgi:UMF1 family MFS transporter